MDFSQEFQVGAPDYLVYRDIPFDTTSPICFFPPKDSDELFDALRIAFPHLRTHAERMGEIVIHFLLSERLGERQSEPSPAMTMDTSTVTWPSVASGSTSSSFSSPELMNFGSFANSPQVDPTVLTRQVSNATSSQNSPPSLDQMTGVFSLSTSSKTKQRTRRKMTDAEKIEYQKRRIVKACEKCAKRKRKCTHNQAEMQTIHKSTTKVAKPASSKSTKMAKQATASREEFLQIDPTFALNGMGADPLPGSNLDGGNFDMFHDALPELDVADFINLDHFQYDHTVPHTHQQGGQYTLHTTHPALDQWSDFTLLDPIFDEHDSNSHQRASQTFTPAELSDSTSARQDVYGNERANPHRSTMTGAQSMASSQHSRGDQQTHIDHSTALQDSREHNISPSATLADGTRNDSTSPHGESQHVPGRPRRPMNEHEKGQAHESTSGQSFREHGTESILQGAQSSIQTDSQHDSLNDLSQRTQTRTLGEGITSDTNLSTELFSLRRRISTRPYKRTSLPGSSKFPVTADPRLQTIASSSAPLSSRIHTALLPHTMSNDQHDIRLSRSPDTRTAHELRPSAHAAFSSSSSQGAAHPKSPSGFHGGASLSPSRDRLSDHRRFRDHHGRPSQSEHRPSDIERFRPDHNGRVSTPAGLPGQKWAAVAVALGVLFLAITFFLPNISLPMAVLASLQPSSMSFAQLAPESESDADDSTTWSKTSTSTSSSLIRDRPLKTRQQLRGNFAWAGFRLFEASVQSWLTGLIHAFGMSPMRFEVL
ncbi:hypothetical protein TI39_contig385g00018 [Zymoseptoria brevis]|uniref:Uncharacterized protein n=1 Tax=Zymoseptoria brevis TaxID=1047168 RepID=A0A0F4GN60_9PEZI|nr:hypothetical protein TI39_contig385g00018 [Zymoseptoria brevis]